MSPLKPLLRDLFAATPLAIFICALREAHSSRATLAVPRQAAARRTASAQ